MEDDGRLAFLLDFDVDTAIDNTKRFEDNMDDLVAHAMKQGHYLENIFKELGVAVDASLNDRLDALRSAAEAAEAEVRNAKAEVERYRSQAEANLSKGYMGEWEDSVKDMADAEKRAAAATQKLVTYKKALLALSDAAGETVSKVASANMVFVSEEEYNRAKELEEELERINSLRAQAANEDDLVGDERTKKLAEYDAQLIETQKELNALNEKARATAESLGDSLGGRVENATTKLYELNSAVKEQQGVYDELKGKLDDVSEKLESAMDFDKDSVPELQKQYKELAEQVENAGNKLADLKGKQKDAEDEADSFADILGEAGDDVEKLDSSFGKATSSISSLSRVFTASKNPITVFRASLSALRGGMKLVELGSGGLKTAFASLWKVIAANPITAIAVAVAGLVAAISNLISSIESASEKQIKLNESEKNFLNLLQQTSNYKTSKLDDEIKAKEKELSIAKSQNKSYSEQYKIEKEILDLKSRKSAYNKGLYSQEVDELEQNRKKLYQYQEQLSKALDAKVRGEDDVYIDLKLNGKLEEEDVDDAIKALQGLIDNTQKKIDIAVGVKKDSDTVDTERARLEKERIDSARSIADAETSAVRAAVNSEISLINDGYAKDVAAAKQASKEKIEDLKKRLAREENLTSKARKAINDNIVSEEKALEQKLAKLKYDRDKKVLDIRRQIEDTMSPVGELSADQQLSALRQTYDRLIDDVRDKLDNKDILGFSPEVIAEYEKLYNAYLDRKKREEALFEKKREVTEIETEKATLDLRLAAVKQNSEEEYRLRADMIEKERQAEIAANKLLAEDQQMDENLINDKYYKQQEDLYKEYLVNLDSDYRQWLSGIDGLTIVELEKLLGESKKALNELLSRKLSGDISVDQSEIDALMAKIEELENRIKNANLSPKQRDAEYWRKIASYVNDLGNSFKDLGDAIEGATGQVVSFVGEAITSVGNTINAVTEGIEKAAETTSTALKVVESASVVLTVISSAMSLVKGLVSLFDDSDEQAERAAQATKHYQNAVAALRREYDALAYAIDKAYGADKQELIKKQIALKEREVQLALDRYNEYKERYEALMRYAEKVGLPIGIGEDFLGDMEEARTEYENLQRQLQDLKDAAVDAIFGNDIQTAIQNFADALTDAWDQGKDASETARDFINNMVRDMIKQALLSAIEGSDMMRQLRSMLEIWIRSLNLGVQNAPGVVLRSIENIGQDIIDDGISKITTPTLDDIYNLGEEWAEALSNSNFAEWWRTMTEQMEGDRTAGTRGIAQASQESIDELNGRMTAVQGHTFQINESTLLIRDNVNAILGSVQRIEANTEELHQMSRDIHSIKATMDIADTQGLRIRS